MPAFAFSAWDERLIEAEAEALRYRMTTSRLRLSQRQVAALQQQVASALEAEQMALEALEAEAVRQHEQQQHALKYGQYISVLSAHLSAASGSCLGTVRLPPESEEVRTVLAEVGVPLGAPLQVLHAYRLHNKRLRDEFNARIKEAYPASPSKGMGSPSKAALSGGVQSLAMGGSPERMREITVPYGYTHRLLALRLAPAAVEHTLVFGLHPKPPPGQALAWQVDPQTVPEAGCVDMASLAKIVGASIPTPTPLPLFAGGAAWEAVLAGEVEEAITARDAAAAGLATARGQASARGQPPPNAPAAQNAAATAITAASRRPQNKLLLLVRVLLPLSEPSPEKHKPPPAVREPPLRSPPCPPPRQVAPPPAGTATAAPSHILPLYLLHYGTMTAPPEAEVLAGRGTGGISGASSISGTISSTASMSSSVSSTPLTEKNVAQREERAAAEPRTASQARDKAGGSSGGAKGAREGTDGDGLRKSKSGRAAAKEAGHHLVAPAALPGEDQPSALPNALRSSREYANYVHCRRVAAERMREVARVFANSIEGMVSQLTPARAACLAEEARREAELQLLVAEAKTELTKLKKGNRDLGSELNLSFY